MNQVKNLDVYKRAHLLALEIYRTTHKFPKEELYGLVSQMRRAALSINSNLSEGSARNSNGEYKQFIGIAQGSVAELEYQMLLSKELGYIPKEHADKLLDELQQILKMLNGLARSLK